MNFGKWIVVAFALFTGFIAMLVMVCLRQDVNLVSENYYKEELKYQEKLDRMNNALALDQFPVIKIDDGQVIISFAPDQPLEKGVLTIARPSNEMLDRNYKLAQNEPLQKFNMGSWSPGLYRASVSWTMNGKDFYYEKQIVL